MINEKAPISINGMEFTKMPGCKYMYSYHEAVQQIKDKVYPEIDHYRTFVKHDLFFIVYFVLKVPIANCPFWVQACKDVQKGPRSHTVDLWARDHGKSTIITLAETIQMLVRNPEERIAIFSHTQKVALKFFRQVKYVLETNEFLKYLFPDVLYQDPAREAWKWSEDSGLYVKRKGGYKEASLEAWGLVEGMPTGAHFSHRVYDDVVTADLVNTPEMMEKVKEAFDLSQNLGTRDGTHRVIGTPYHHEDPLMYIISKKDLKGKPIYHVRKKPATHDGTPNGESVYLPAKKLDELRTNRRMFNAQQLLDPTPSADGQLDPDNVKDIAPSEIPENLFKLMAIDPAGIRVDRRGDDWAIILAGIKPEMDDLGASEIYILDMLIAEMTLKDALSEVVQMYLRGGVIRRLGVEKVAMNTTEVHVANALRARGKHISVEAGNLQILRPAGRKKEFRIESALSWPVANQKIKISTAVPSAMRDRLRLEMRKFPFYRDDGLDALSYIYDMVKDFQFGRYAPVEEKRVPWYWREQGEAKNTKDGWMLV